MNSAPEDTALCAVAGASAGQASLVPPYLSRTYSWAYLSQRTLPWLDRPEVVSAILWGNARRLMRAAVAEFEPGSRVLQAACVYGPFSGMLARRLGAAGELDVVDVAEIQVDNARRKLVDAPWARVRRKDLADADIGVEHGSLDAACSFFLLHEVPDDARRRIVDNLLAAVRVGGKVVFTDYHRPRWWHPLGPVMALVFRTLEPYAISLLRQDIAGLSTRADDFAWKKTTAFGGLYQQMVATRLR
jgi:SAM-dependent methyltransferase